ncbi:hypothetical protein EHW66_15115 [Erwinia psidii]|uniref:Uncharacterized protein n=1 Tax=Erwinia psidii TaxID=69224 RepID=A0A3N6SHG0_9GAMM|nr:hypothetical protein [Erwinia psidii]MCX8960246.1 hypothetical protein [Erwinia psidii]MCX8966268.1 hypothetical protein [Erwinia psidii]RQM36976.1 hypothetical protein EB241_17510 [Erwinia psidii]
MKPQYQKPYLTEWAGNRGVTPEFIKPDKLTQNVFFNVNRTDRTEILDFYLFGSLNEVREITEK